MIEVILREDVKSLGKAGALVRVKPGYARNFLLPRGLAYEASEGNKKRIAAEQKARDTKSASERVEAQKIAAALGALSVTVSAKAGEGEEVIVVPCDLGRVDWPSFILTAHRFGSGLAPAVARSRSSSANSISMMARATCACSTQRSSR